MIRQFVLAALLISATGPLNAAEPILLETWGDKSKALPEDAADSYEALVAALEAEDARVRAHNDAVQATAEYRAAREASDRETLEALGKELERVNYQPFVERAVAGAKQFAGTDGAIDFLGFTAQRGKEDQARNALATLKEHHLESAKLEKWVGLAGWYVRPTDRATVLDFLRAVDRSNNHDKVRANAIYQIYRVLSRDREATQEMKDAAEARLPEAAQLAGEGPLRDRINAPMFERERLQIGMVAPDIEGEDLNGVEFKLSDYRGKVVVLDFWGDW